MKNLLILLFAFISITALSQNERTIKVSANETMSLAPDSFVVQYQIKQYAKNNNGMDNCTITLAEVRDEIEHLIKKSKETNDEPFFITSASMNFGNNYNNPMQVQTVETYIVTCESKEDAKALAKTLKTQGVHYTNVFCHLKRSTRNKAMQKLNLMATKQAKAYAILLANTENKSLGDLISITNSNFRSEYSNSNNVYNNYNYNIAYNNQTVGSHNYNFNLTQLNVSLEMEFELK